MSGPYFQLEDERLPKINMCDHAEGPSSNGAPSYPYKPRQYATACRWGFHKYSGITHLVERANFRIEIGGSRPTSEGPKPPPDRVIEPLL
jgi:hypothetical protein